MTQEFAVVDCDGRSLWTGNEVERGSSPIECFRVGRREKIVGENRRG
jgi:hypothetical protein